LGDEKEQSALCRGGLDRAKRPLASDEERHRDVREHDDIAEWENRETAQV
jgi:hypothetical protein